MAPGPFGPRSGAGLGCLPFLTLKRTPMIFRCVFTVPKSDSLWVTSRFPGFLLSPRFTSFAVSADVSWLSSPTPARQPGDAWVLVLLLIAQSLRVGCRRGVFQAENRPGTATCLVFVLFNIKANVSHTHTHTHTHTHYFF